MIGMAMVTTTALVAATALSSPFSVASAGKGFAPIRMVVGGPVVDTYGRRWVSEYGAVGGLR